MKKLTLLIIVFLVTYCKQEAPTFNSKNEISKTNPKVSKRIGDYMSDEQDFFWSPKQKDSSHYWVRLVFQEEFVIYQFHVQCIYYYFTNHYHTGTDEIELLWSYKTDCLLDMDFLNNSNGMERFPKDRDKFCEYKLLNDSTIYVKYNFPEWVKKVNLIAKDSLFPSYFYLEKRNGI